MAIVFDVVESFPSGFPARGDVVVLWPERTGRRVAIMRYPHDPSFEEDLIRYAHHLRCRESDCPRCPLLEACPSPRRRIALLR